MESSQFSSVTQSCPTLCDPMDCSTPGLPVHHQLPEFTQTHVLRVSDAISHLILCRPLLLLPPIPPSIRVFSNESTLHMRWPKYWKVLEVNNSWGLHCLPSKSCDKALPTCSVLPWTSLWSHVPGIQPSTLSKHHIPRSPEADVLSSDVSRSLMLEIYAVSGEEPMESQSRAWQSIWALTKTWWRSVFMW